MAKECDQVLPVPGQRNLLITSALPYVNNVPHLGNIIGCVLSADVYARFGRLRGYNVAYICGTDEYGTATEQKALKEGVTPRQICDKYHAVHAQVYKWFDIQFDIFGRTSTPVQTEIVQSIFQECEENGIIHEDVVEQLYCQKCDSFLADRYVGGTCPDCGYVGAHGDQCDGCGHLMNAVLLKDPHCVADMSTPIVKSSQHLFIDLPKCQSQLSEWIDKASVEGHWSANSIQVTKAWLATGLKSRSITRDLKWGIPVPKDGFRDKVFYVWFDAPIGYLSITAAYTPEWRKWWINSDPDTKIELVQFMGKDNIPFHTVIFPCTLIGADQGYTMLHHISTTEYLNYEDGKFSKSKGVGVFGDSVQLTGVSSSVWRYYLLTNRPETADTVFTWDDFQQKNNGELLKNLGNFINRALVFVAKFFDGVVPGVAELHAEDDQFIADMNAKAVQYCEELDLVHIKDALKLAMLASSRCNLYFQDLQPWKLHKEGDLARAGTVVTIGVNAVVVLATLIEPYMPQLTQTILGQMNLPKTILSLVGGSDGKSFFDLNAVPRGHKTNTPQVLFNPISNEEIAHWRATYGGVQGAGEEFPLDLVTGLITTASIHPNADTLYELTVDIGEETERKIVSGLRKFYEAEELIGKKIVIVRNLAPATICGSVSNGMLLCGVDKSGQTGLVLSHGNPGDSAIPDGYVGPSSKAKLDKKKFGKAAGNLSVEDGSVFYKGSALVSCAQQPLDVDRIDGSALIR